MNSNEQTRMVGSRPRDWAGLSGLTAAAVLIHGYHVGIEDQAIYLPAVLKHLDPTLFPRDAFFFEAQTRPMLLDEILAGVIRTTHLSLEWTLLLFHLLTIFLLLLACWRIARRCWDKPEATWAGLAVITCMLTLPIAGTAQYIVDQYLHPRALATALVLIPVADLLPGIGRMRGRKLVGWCALWFGLAVILHLQIAVFGLAMWVFLAMRWEKWFPVLGNPVYALAPIPIIGKLFEPGSPAWEAAARTRSQHYLLRWEWYEWLGIIAPMVLLWWFGSVAAKQGQSTLAWLSRRVAVFGTLALVGGLVLVLPPAFERLTPYQPMRIFILIYIFLLLIGGGLLGQFVLQRKAWRWLVLFIPMAAGMFIAQTESFPASPHIEWPGSPVKNDWVRAFLWVRENTPKDAYFALSPHYLSRDGEDYHGFRAWAWRGQMADLDKDPGVVSLVPALAPEWQREVRGLEGWNQFTSKDFERLHRDFGVNWVVVTLAQKVRDELTDSNETLTCPYQNPSVAVCRVR